MPECKAAILGNRRNARRIISVLAVITTLAVLVSCTNDNTFGQSALKERLSSSVAAGGESSAKPDVFVQEIQVAPSFVPVYDASHEPPEVEDVQISKAPFSPTPDFNGSPVSSPEAHEPDDTPVPSLNPNPISGLIPASSPVPGPEPVLSPPALSPSPEMKLSPASVILKQGESVKINAFAGNSEENPSWNSRDESIASVSAEGVITAKSAGETMVSAVFKNGDDRSCLVSVISSESVQLSESSVTLEKGSSKLLLTKISPESAALKPIIFLSSNPDVAQVDSNGVVFAVNPGMAVITGTTSGGAYAQCSVTVIAPIRQIYLSAEKALYAVGDTGKINIALSPDIVVEQVFAYESSDNSIASISDGVFACQSAGTVTFTVISPNGVSAKINITVIDLQAYIIEAINLTNIERVKAGVHEFTVEKNAATSAKIRSDEITVLYSHTRPDGSTCFTVFAEVGVKYLSAGENIASGQKTPEEVIAAWMNSDGHRGNMLNPKFKYIGIGVSLDSKGVLYWTQLFYSN